MASQTPRWERESNWRAKQPLPDTESLEYQKNEPHPSTPGKTTPILSRSRSASTDVTDNKSTHSTPAASGSQAISMNLMQNTPGEAPHTASRSQSISTPNEDQAFTLDAPSQETVQPHYPEGFPISPLHLPTLNPANREGRFLLKKMLENIGFKGPWLASTETHPAGYAVPFTEALNSLGVLPPYTKEHAARREIDAFCITHGQWCPGTPGVKPSANNTQTGGHTLSTKEAQAPPRPFAQRPKNMPSYRGGQGRKQNRVGPRVKVEDYIRHVQPQEPPYNGPGQIDPVLSQFVTNGISSPTSVMDHVPFVNKIAGLGPSRGGVVRISDIPYGIDRKSILALWGPNARIKVVPPQTPYYAIYVIMERNSGKTMDAFVEFETQRDAETAITRFDLVNDPRRRNPPTRRGRLGDRAVTITMADQATLMASVFPRAKCVVWNGQEPQIIKPAAGHLSPFDGFLNTEEFYNIKEYIGDVKRSRYAVEHIQRAYEDVITIINKYPWWRVELYVAAERDKVANLAVHVVGRLADLLKDENSTIPNELTLELLEELLTVSLSCPAFNENQRLVIYKASNELVGMPRWVSLRLARWWPFEALTRRDDTSEGLLGWYANLIKEFTVQQTSAEAVNGDAPKAELLRKHQHDLFGTMAESRPSKKFLEVLMMQSVIEHEQCIMSSYLYAAAEELAQRSGRLQPMMPNSSSYAQSAGHQPNMGLLAAPTPDNGGVLLAPHHGTTPQLMHPRPMPAQLMPGNFRTETHSPFTPTAPAFHPMHQVSQTPGGVPLPQSFLQQAYHGAPHQDAERPPTAFQQPSTGFQQPQSHFPQQNSGYWQGHHNFQQPYAGAMEGNMNSYHYGAYGQAAMR